MSSSPAIIDGKYELVELAGEGGMASVWKAAVRGAAGFSRTVAIKKIKQEFRAIRNYTDMFIEEARVGAELAHPNIVQVYDFCADAEGSYYIVMEWVEGMDLGSLVKAYREAGQHMPWPLVVAAGIGTLRGLGAAHERRRPDGTPAPIVHRDVSPHNVLVGTNGVVKLTDFGLARARDRVFSLTAPGTVKGKLSYLSPEVAMGGQATPLSDLFAMGAVLWESLVGERLFDGRSDLEVFKQIRQCLVRPLAPARPDVPPELIAIVNGALTKEPERRFGSASAMAYMLADVLKLAPPGLDPQLALGQAVASVRQRMGVKRNPTDADHLPTWKWQGAPHAPQASNAAATSPARVLAEKGRVETGPAPGSGDFVGNDAESVDVDLEFSKPDLTVEPLTLTPKPKK
jgi:serine/threonine protein kinase